MNVDTELLTQTSAPMEDLGIMPCVSILNEAANLIGGDRNKTHGNKRRNFEHTALLWSAYLSDQLNASLRPDQVAVMMALLKISRTASGTPIRDHYTDMAGYAAIAGELAL